MSRAKFTKIQKEILYTKYMRGSTVKELAEYYDCSKTCILSNIKRYAHDAGLIDIYRTETFERLKQNKQFNLWNYVNYAKDKKQR